MAHVTEFEIEGLAGRKDVYAKKLNLDVNIFFGLNGSGKTSLLKMFLHSAMEGNALMLKSVPFTAAEVKIYSKKYDTVVTRTIEKKQLPVQRELPDIEKTPVVEFYKYRNLLYDRFTFGEGIEWKTQGIQKEKKDVSWIHRYLPITRLYLDSARYSAAVQHRHFAATNGGHAGYVLCTDHVLAMALIFERAVVAGPKDPRDGNCWNFAKSTRRQASCL